MSDDESLLDSFPLIVQMRFRNLSNEYIMMIADKLNQLGTVDPADIQAILQMKMHGNSLTKIEKKLSQACNMTVDDIYKVFLQVAQQSYEAAASLADIVDVKYDPHLYDQYLIDYVNTISEATAQTFQNISQTTGVGIQYRNADGKVVFLSMGDAYSQAIDDAITRLTVGVEDYEKVKKRILQMFYDSGLRESVQYESGYHRRLDSAARMNVLDGMRDVFQGIQTEMGNRFGADGVEISAHPLCAPDHQPYQGYQYTNKEFKEIQDSLPRPFGKWNCRHLWWSIIVGVSVPAHSNAELAQYRRQSNEVIKFEGKKMTRYEATQEMRKIETEVRKSKELERMYKKAGDDTSRRAQRQRISQLRNKYSDLAGAAKLEEQPERMSAK